MLSIMPRQALLRCAGPLLPQAVRVETAGLRLYSIDACTRRSRNACVSSSYAGIVAWRLFTNTSSPRLSRGGAGLLHPSSLCRALTPGTRPKPALQDPLTCQPLRLHGTVTAFKHRRGYGFVLAEGVVPNSAEARRSNPTTYVPLPSVEDASVPASARADRKAEKVGTDGDGVAPPSPTSSSLLTPDQALHKTFFFARFSLQGGFYVMEGERVSFTVVPATPQNGSRRLGGASAAAGAHAEFHEDDADDAAAADFSLGEGAASPRPEHHDSDPGTPHLYRASLVRYYDPHTATETPITPEMLYGKVVEWSTAENRGLIAELDTQQRYHPDAPRFAVSGEDLDVSPGTELRVGRYVRFCLGFASLPPSPSASSGGGAVEEGEEVSATDVEGGEGESNGELVAKRVIIDAKRERRMGVFGRPLAPATAEPGTVTDQSRFSGVVRDVRPGSFGFILDDLSGESIFFHLSNASNTVKVGDHVSYLLRELEKGKHAGKKACFDVQWIRSTPSTVRRHHGDKGVREAKKMPPTVTSRDVQDVDFDLLD